MHGKTYLTAAIATGAFVTSASFGALLGIAPQIERPTLVYGNTGNLTYHAATDLLAITSDPLAIQFVAGDPPRFVQPTSIPGSPLLTINIVVDDTGTLFGGVPGEDLLITGEVDADGNGTIDYAGVLLTGEIAEFGWMDSGAGGTTDQYDMRFTVTGGSLADDFYTGKDIGVTVTSESSTFDADFTVNFTGEAKGNLGPIEVGNMEGCTPGYWKQEHHFDSWPAPYSHTDLFVDVFGPGYPGNPTLGEALRLKKGGLNALVRHSVAALLNAASPNVYAEPEFDTPGEVVAAYQAAFDSGEYELLKNLLDDANNSGCPLN
jgi:hypothetical protein